MKLSRLFLIAAAALVLNGCSDSPSDVHEKILDLMCSADISGMKDYATPESATTLDGFQSMVAEIEITSEEINGNTAIVTTSDGKKDHYRKVDGEWKVHISK
jgi:PBP1b-binding outer membrane lipoprotein LpoB